MGSGLKLLALLDEIGTSADAVTISTLARKMGRPRAEVHRQLVTLVTAGWMAQRGDGAYALTLRPALVGQAALHHSGMSERIEELLEELARSTGEAASVAVLDGDSARIVQRAEPGRALRVTLSLGAKLALWDSATGRVLMAFSPSETVAALRDRGVRVPSDEELALVRRDGHASSLDQPGDNILGIAVPVDDGPGGVVRAVSISGPRERVDVGAALQSLRDTAAAMNELLSVNNTLGVRHALG
ncbi:IclR family transcriptional regulator [Specibacter cremeus]|uniref:IclR family transcriptional regulator n=1 Tax=Specibacter cremeus TaxID=1629051 RepID=UPI00197C0F69|nr:IclR family transcriptional regulator [Specibacter cremeus]